MVIVHSIGHISSSSKTFVYFTAIIFCWFFSTENRIQDRVKTRNAIATKNLEWQRPREIPILWIYQLLMPCELRFYLGWNIHTFNIDSNRLDWMVLPRDFLVRRQENVKRSFQKVSAKRHGIFHLLVKF